MFDTRQFFIARFYLTGEFVQKNVLPINSEQILFSELKLRWDRFFSKTGLQRIPILQKKAFLDVRHLSLSEGLLQSGFDIVYTTNEFAALSLELIREDARFNMTPRDPSFPDAGRNDPVVAFCDPNSPRELLSAAEILAPRNQLIVLSDRIGPVEARPFLDQWINLSSNQQIKPRYQEDSWYEYQGAYSGSENSETDNDEFDPFARNTKDTENTDNTENTDSPNLPVFSGLRCEPPAVPVQNDSEKAIFKPELKTAEDSKTVKTVKVEKTEILKTVKKPETIVDSPAKLGLTKKNVKEPVPKVQPDVLFWKEKIQKILDNFVEGKGGRIPAERALFWLYSLQLNCDINSLTSQNVLISSDVFALLQDNLPTRVRWMEESGAPAELLHINHPEIQPVPAQQAAEQLQLGVKFSPESEDNAAGWTTSAQSIQSAPEIGHIIESADLFSHYCRWTLQKKQLEKRGVAAQSEISKTEESFDLQAQKISLYNWIKWNSFSKDDLYEELATCYDSLIASFRLLKMVQNGALESNELKTVYKKSAQIAADVQCGLKSWLRDQCFDISVDHVLNEAYRYLVELAREEQFFLYHLKAVDALPLSTLVNLNEEINSLKEQFFSRNIETKQQKKLKGKLEYDAKKLADNCKSVEQWNRVIKIATDLMDDFGMPPSDLFFRQVFDPIMGKIPDEADTTESFGRIVQEIEIYNSRLKEAQETPLDLEIDLEFPTNVQKVRQKFGGTHAVFIGGEPKEHIMKRIEERLKLKVDWNSTNHGDSLSRFDKWLNDPDVSLFLIYIPWCSHKHSEDLASMVERAGKTLVRLRKGTNPDIIAEAICLQAIGRR